MVGLWSKPVRIGDPWLMQTFVLLIGVVLLLGAPAPARAQDLDALHKEMAGLLGQLAQHELALPFNQTALPCFASWVTGDEDNVVRNVAPIVQTAGLRPGDTITRIGTQTLASERYSWQTAMSRLTRGLTSFFVEVSRGGKTVVVTMPCQSQLAARMFESRQRHLAAIVKGDWPVCIAAGKAAINVFGAPMSEMFYRMESCAELGGIEDKEYADYLYGYAYALILEIRALDPKPEEAIEAIADRLDRLDYLRVKGGDDRATPLRTAMTSIGLTPPPFDAAALIERVLEAAKTVPASASTGTGFVVHSSGTIITAHHVIEGASAITAQCGTGQPLEATVRSTSAALDIAVLGVKPASPLTYLDVARDVADVGLGSAIFTIGYPVTELLGKDAKFSEGTISGLSGVAGDASFFQVSVPIQPGNSGGALIDSRGRVIGVVLSMASAPLFVRLTGTLPQNINWAVKIPAVRTLFTPPAARPAAASREAAIKQAVAPTCFIRATS